MIDLQDILAKMNLNQKINYDKVMMKMVSTWQKDQIRPKILLHSCCAPCSTTTLERMTEFADVTIYFANSNIHPRAEYQRREYVQQKFIHDFNEKTGNNVQFVAAPYKPQEYFQAVRGLEKEPEGGDRCKACFDYRLDMVAKKAVELGFDYFGSALTISPHKNSQTINSVGIEIQRFYDVNYLQVILRRAMVIGVQLRCVRNMTSTVNVTVVAFLLLNNKVLIYRRLDGTP